MTSGAPLSIPEMRLSSRHAVDLTLKGEHLTQGEAELHITNISQQGFMINNCDETIFSRGYRIIIRLPAIGRIEAYCIWIAGERAGFQFERIIRADDFTDFLKEIKPRAAMQVKRRR